MFFKSSLVQRNGVDLLKEARDCRRYARELANRPEGPFLLRLADAFDELAREERSSAL